MHRRHRNGETIRKASIELFYSFFADNDIPRAQHPKTQRRREVSLFCQREKRSLFASFLSHTESFTRTKRSMFFVQFRSKDRYFVRCGDSLNFARRFCCVIQPETELLFNFFPFIFVFSRLINKSVCPSLISSPLPQIIPIPCY